ncbi:vWA domain-containing protein [Salsipaludibacter albus]|uniref:vWA domain-containing protein n=1 Tax=Salsipaludibacter albus TaxID=2849650 RepID=UPI001EE49FF8|nr:VWA domain-containing protein [Salsipaludibacter albus]MBY5162240.1 VWA domain-containing protein [Salsipaludibacter albus]
MTARPAPDQSDALGEPDDSGLFDRTLAFVGALRRAGVTATQSEAIDAVRALGEVDLLRRPVVREALATVTVSSGGDRRTFDDLFELYFPARRVPSDGEALPAEHVGEDGEVDRDAFDTALLDALLGGDDDAVRRLAREAVDAFGRVEGRDGQPAFFSYRVRRALDPHTLLDSLLEARGATDDDARAQRLLRDEFEERLAEFRREVDAEIRRRTAERSDLDDLADRVVKPALDEVDFFRMTAAEAAELRAQVAPLARKLATRTQVKRRRGRDGRLDVRRTVRRSLSTGGVPMDPVFRPRKPHKPELVVITDVSGSVASFARFTLMLVHSLQEQFSRVRSFAFIDTLDEVTELFEGRDFDEAIRRMSSEADLVWLDGHSDYGHAFEVFHERFVDEITPRSTVLVLGDARNNYRASSSWVLAEIATRARRVYWLNPESAAYWGTGDSITADYARHVEDMVEVRNLRQLADFVRELT